MSSLSPSHMFFLFTPQHVVHMKLCNMNNTIREIKMTIARGCLSTYMLICVVTFVCAVGAYMCMQTHFQCNLQRGLNSITNKMINFQTICRSQRSAHASLQRLNSTAGVLGQDLSQQVLLTVVCYCCLLLQIFFNVAGFAFTVFIFVVVVVVIIDVVL